MNCDSCHYCPFPSKYAAFLRNPNTTMEDYESGNNTEITLHKCGKVFCPCEVPPPPTRASCDCCGKVVKYNTFQKVAGRRPSRVSKKHRRRNKRRHKSGKRIRRRRRRLSRGVMHGCLEHNIHLCFKCNSKSPEEMKDLFEKMNTYYIQDLDMDFECGWYHKESIIERLQDPYSELSNEYGEEQRLEELEKWKNGQYRSVSVGRIY